MTETRQRQASYPNFISKIIMKPLFENQWVIPDDPPRSATRFLEWYEKRIMKVDISEFPLDRPIFLISLPRCGSSMLQDLLCAHPGIGYTTNMMHTFRSSLCAAEHFRKKLGFNVRGERFLCDSVDVDGGSPADPVATWAEFLKQDPWSVDFHETTVDDFTAEELDHIRTSIRKMLWCFGKPVRRFECKTPALLPHALLLKDIFPDAKFIHLVRDGRDNANSLLKLHRLCNEQWRAIRERAGETVPEDQIFVPYPRFPGLPGYIEEFGADDIRTAAHLWKDGVNYVRDIKDKLPTFYEVRYEDILKAPREEMGKLFDFCELERPTPENQAFEAKIGGVGVVRHKNKYGNYDVVEEICREPLERYGYL